MKNPNEIAPERKELPKPYDGLTFVVADDQLAVREAVANYLSQLGAEVVRCHDGQECFAAVKILHPTYCWSTSECRAVAGWS